VNGYLHLLVVEKTKSFLVRGFKHFIYRQSKL